MVGYVLGDWHTIAMRTAQLSASQNIALRFPEASAEPVADAEPAPPARATNAIILGDTSAALLSPAPMIASAVVQRPPAPQQPAAALAPAPVRVATAADTVPLGSMPVAAAAPAPRAPAATTQAAPEAKAETKLEPKADMKVALAPQPKPTNAAEGGRGSNRQVFVLNDTQIASIKRRLHLSPDQEQMWPAVEAALRSIAYSKSRDGRHRGGATSAEVASLDPYGPEVQGLKSAAFPLVMSFSDEQRSEVRSIVHVMGLDQLASQL
jgi:hypothetical protein